MRQNLKVIWENVGVTVRLRPKILSDSMVQVNLIGLKVNDVVQIDKSRGLDLPRFSEALADRYQVGAQRTNSRYRRP